jgi:hypothetical protein
MVPECPDLTWNQILIASDRLSEEGVLTLSPKGCSQYAITFPTLVEASHRAKV